MKPAIYIVAILAAVVRLCIGLAALTQPPRFGPRASAAARLDRELRVMLRAMAQCEGSEVAGPELDGLVGEVRLRIEPDLQRIEAVGGTRAGYASALGERNARCAASDCADRVACYTR